MLIRKTCGFPPVDILPHSFRFRPCNISIYFILTKRLFFYQAQKVLYFSFLCLHNYYAHFIDQFSFYFKSNPHFPHAFYEIPVIFVVKCPLFHMFIHIYTSVSFYFTKNHSCLFLKIKSFFPFFIMTFLFRQENFSHDFRILSALLWYIFIRYDTICCGYKLLTATVLPVYF